MTSSCISASRHISLFPRTHTDTAFVLPVEMYLTNPSPFRTRSSANVSSSPLNTLSFAGSCLLVELDDLLSSVRLALSKSAAAAEVLVGELPRGLRSFSLSRRQGSELRLFEELLACLGEIDSCMVLLRLLEREIATEAVCEGELDREFWERVSEEEREEMLLRRPLCNNREKKEVAEFLGFSAITLD